MSHEPQMSQEPVTTDPLTRLYNVKFLHTVLSWETARACRYEVPLTMLLLEVDHLAQISESWGQRAEDEVLKRLAAMLQSNLRNTDFVFRYGDSQFALLLPHTDLANSMHVRQRILQRLEGSEVQVILGLSITTTIAASEYGHGSVQSFISNAERALARAKGGDDDDPSGVAVRV